MRGCLPKLADEREVYRYSPKKGASPGVAHGDLARNCCAATAPLRRRHLQRDASYRIFQQLRGGPAAYGRILYTERRPDIACSDDDPHYSAAIAIRRQKQDA